MKIRWLPIIAAALFALQSVDATARAKSSGRASASVKSKSAAKAKSSAKAGSTRHARGKHGRGKRRAPPPPPMVQGEGADTPVQADAVRPRNIPTRAYAADGQSFYLNGERIRVRGAPLAAPGGSELAKQRLQKVLDVGEVTISDKELDEHGNATAIVRVNGRDVTDLLLLDEIRSGNLP